MRNVHTYQQYSDGEVETMRFSQDHSEESQSFITDVRRTGLPFQNAIRLVNKWNSQVGKRWDTRYWLVLS